MLIRILLSLILAILPTGCSQAAEVREPAVAGAFYPAKAAELEKMVSGFLNEAPKKELPGEVVAIIVPHAGYIFSGQVAAYGFKQLEGKYYDTVILLGLSHSYPLYDSFVTSRGWFKTPLGLVKIDEKLSNKITGASRLIKTLPLAHREEHSLEVELPFLQKVLDYFEIVPILIQDYTLETAGELARAIVDSIGDKKVLIVASADLSHYPPGTVADQVDGETLKAIETLDPEIIDKTSKAIMGEGHPNLSCTICAEGAAVTAVMAANLLGADQAEILKYANSGDTAGDDSRVVGYGAVAITRKEVVKSDGIYINKPEQEELLQLARNSIKEHFKTGGLPQYKTTKPELTRKSGVFVTLKKDGYLRGCIGHIQAVEPLYAGIMSMAQAAAFQDSRFPAVTEKELDKVSIEISVLSPLKEVDSADEIVLGRDGVVVKHGWSQGIFLPQVADETGWTKEEFLTHLCRDKAGLRGDAWKDRDTQIYTFTVQKFTENKE